MNWEKLLSNGRIRPSNREDKGSSARNDFESDFGRIIFSPAIRRLHDKAQVFPLTTDDNIHSRLTHSMEVMSVGYSMGVKLCENKTFQERVGKEKYDLFREIPVIIKNCCLVHDIGNPPFGHFGETVIQNCFKSFFSNDCIFKQSESDFTEEDKKSGKYYWVLTDEQKNDFHYFDGNAQVLRVLSKLQILNDPYGLNLTYATLASYMKYPHYGVPEKNHIETKKHGVFYSEKKYFDEIVENCGLKNGSRILRHPLSYIVEAADSICYLVMDIEDGYNKKLFDFDYLYNKLKDIPSVKNKVKNIYDDNSNFYKNDNTKVANLRIYLISVLVDLAVKNFLDNSDKIEDGNYDKELIDDDTNKLAKALQNICIEKIFAYRDINSLEVTGYSVITGLLNHYIKFIFHEDKSYRNRTAALISKSLVKAALAENGIDIEDKTKGIDDLKPFYKLKVIVDFISGMTDQFALSHYQKISGQRIN